MIRRPPRSTRVRSSAASDVYKRQVYVSGEVGVGGAIVLDGAIYAGRHGWCGEIGQTRVGTAGSFDEGGTLESYAGEDAIVEGAEGRRSAAHGGLVAAGQRHGPRAVEA